MADEPTYLRMLRKDRDARTGKPGATPATPAVGKLTVQEQEALRWAKERAGGVELRSTKGLAGARYAVLLKITSVTGTATLALEGLPSRELLVARLKRGTGMGEELVGAYEVKGGRPITVTMTGDQVQLTMGTPRPGANPLPPEKMMRKAEAQAAARARTRSSAKEPRSRK